MKWNMVCTSHVSSTELVTIVANSVEVQRIVNQWRVVMLESEATMARIFSVDAEVDGLYGTAFAVAVTVREDGVEIARFEARTPDEGVTNPWVRENVLPALAGWVPTHSSSEELEEAFWAFYALHALEAGEWGPSPRKDVAVIAMFGSPVESGLFRRCVERDSSRTFQGPYPLHEVGTLLLALGEEAPDSTEAYLKKYGLESEYDGVAHHPTYDAVTAAQVWEHALSRLRK